MREREEEAIGRKGSLPSLSPQFLPSSAEFKNCAAEDAVDGVAKGRLLPPRFRTFPSFSSLSSASSASRCTAVVD